MKRTWRAHHADLSPQAGDHLRLSPEEAHHIRGVLRLKQGDRLRLFDGKGLEWHAVITSVSKSAVEVELVQPYAADVEPQIQVEIFQGLCRQDRMEWVIQKGTELGASAIHPLLCDRGAKGRITPERLQRWNKIAIEAAKQSGRQVIPLIRGTKTLPTPEPSGPLALLFTSGGQARPLGAILGEARPSAVWLAVGPEAGFSAEETESWAAAGWRRTTLGPRVLRTETASVTAAAIILHIWGDLGSGPG